MNVVVGFAIEKSFDLAKILAASIQIHRFPISVSVLLT